MNVNGIGAAGYPVAGYETRRTERNVAGGKFADAINKAATQNEIPKGTNAFRPESSDEVMQAWDKSGNVTEQMVDVSKVDPENCDTAEMYAYTAHLKESGKGSFEDTVLKAAVAKAVKNAEQRSSATWSFSEKTDWVKIVNDIMQSEYRYGDLKGYMEWKKFLGFLEK